MRILFDAHALLWFPGDSPLLTARVREILSRPGYGSCWRRDLIRFYWISSAP